MSGESQCFLVPGYYSLARTLGHKHSNEFAPQTRRRNHSFGVLSGAGPLFCMRHKRSLSLFELCQSDPCPLFSLVLVSASDSRRRSPHDCSSSGVCVPKSRLPSAADPGSACPCSRTSAHHLHPFHHWQPCICCTWPVRPIVVPVAGCVIAVKAWVDAVEGRNNF